MDRAATVPVSASSNNLLRRYARALHDGRKVILYAALGSFALAMLTPFLMIAITSVGKGWFGKMWLPATFGFDWYVRAWSLQDIPRVLTNTVLIAGLAVAISTLIGIPTGWALGRRAIRGKQLWMAILLMPRMIPPLAFALGIARIFYGIQMVDTYLGVALAHVAVATPYAILVLSSTFEGLDERVLEAAEVLGANPWQKFFHVILPLVFPGILASMIFTFTTSYNEFTLTIMTYGPHTITMPVITYLSIGDGYWEIASAMSMILLMPSLLVLFLIQRQLKPEALVGGFKGV